MQYNNTSQGRPNIEPNCYVKFKSKGLWAIVCSALEDASVLSSTEEATVRELHIKIIEFSF
jgi:hypothetical protein